MSESPVLIGREVIFAKTISESDVYLYAGITGDFSPNHIDLDSTAISENERCQRAPSRSAAR